MNRGPGITRPLVRSVNAHKRQRTGKFIGSGDDVLPVWHQSITLSDAELLWTFWNFTEIWIKIDFFSFQENAFKMAFTMCQQCWPQYVKSVESFEARCCYWSTLSLRNRMIEIVLVTQLNVVVFIHLLLLISNLITIITPPISWVNS